MSVRDRQEPLAYFQSSPVRGQLEPYDGDARTGWRYLQCTDTPNELKVLLPPRTALLYSQLLQVENSELARGREASWTRILEVRHLKDRMIRKCQRLSRSSAPSSGVTAAFRIIHAPPDFRLKEMERWLKNEDPTRTTKSHAMEATRTPTRSQSPASFCSQCGPRASGAHSHAHSHSSSNRSSRISQGSRTPISQRIPTRNTATGKKRSSVSSQSTTYTQSHSSAEKLKPTYPSVGVQSKPPYLSPVVEERSDRSVQATPAEEEAPPLPNPYSTPSVLEEERIADDSSTRENVISPDPLPHPYRAPSMHLAPGAFQQMPEPIIMPQPEIPNMGGSDLGSVAPAPPPLDAELQYNDGGASNRPIPRRRSSLKQPNARLSINGSQKVVSWAMDKDWTDQMSKFDRIVYAAELAGGELDIVRRRFQDEIDGVKGLRQNITLALERLRLQTEQLELEERALRDHEENLTSTFGHLQDKESRYKAAVKNVLDETKRVVTTAGTKRDEVLS
ncbi:hypothetical protein EVG20_g142 [Dentipellis fragilis]|uniref:Uncharacterized protein n=1 Tax=Dentipellis fragilis TaxID=205917 RepID=A0A4Y9ZGB9_9AGAM|nr:hypothetical protein EVG20_g142 [Dentipellis fragilis]